METITASEIKENGTGYKWLGTVDQAFAEMLEAIEAAQLSIRLEIYIYRASPISEQFRDALIRARARGVRVKVLLDALGSISLPERFWEDFIKGGGEFRWFNPLKFKRLGLRNHRKVLVCDEKVAFIGGFNIAPEYQGDGVNKGWHDVGLKVPAPVAKELAASFEGLFALADFQHKRFARLRKSPVAHVSPTSHGELIFSAPGRGPFYLKSSILADLRNSEEINIISAYFLPPRQMRRAIANKARQGGKVRLIMAGKSDVALSQMASRRLYQGFLSAGVEIYEYQPQIMHTKLFIFDEATYVGSANLDKRSLFINYELSLRVHTPDVQREANRFFNEALKNSKKIDALTWSASRTFWTKLKEQWAFVLLGRVDPYLARVQWAALQS